MPTRKWCIHSEKVKRTNVILKTLIKKLIDKKKENKFFNCIPYYEFLLNKYGTHIISIEDCFKLFFLQNRDFFFSKKLMNHICTTISNASILSILKIKKEYIIDHLYNCNIYKYKCFFHNEFYHFIHNILLLCCMQLCTPAILEIVDEEQKQRIKLKNLHKFYSPNKYVLLFDEKNKSNKRICNNIEFFLKLYRCFSYNNISPFSFLNKYIYHNFYNIPINILIRNYIICYPIFKEVPILSSCNSSLFHNEKVPYLKLHEICQMLFYLSKNNLNFYFESFLNIYFYPILIYTFGLTNTHLYNSVLSYLKEENEVTKIKETQNIDNLIVSFINYLSSSYVIKNIKSSILSIMLCIYISSTLFHALYKRHFVSYNWSNFSTVHNVERKIHNFVLVTGESISHINSLSFMKKCILLVYIINAVFPVIYENVVYSRDKYNKEEIKTAACYYNNILQNCIKIYSHRYNNTTYRSNKTIHHTYADSTIKQMDMTASQNIKYFTTELFSKNKKFNFLNFVKLPFLKALHYEIFLYTECNKNSQIVNIKKSLLENEIFYFLQQYVQKTIPNYICQRGTHNASAFFTIDIQILKRT
ncbi:conserved Plasmodium protein, unknown function [Plasmodium malariae]|uniref:Uncharacterized protein n=2 Tax=Plasmodium (Plasmodium) TaxID=418103 RepID=A0A1D3JKG1_PLAMA|nr:conserved Plasmodium protein, unknown function [Plasmodium malariae]SBT86892.1 conserved Plasmodium protein, unknown function [Plasmodium malariae]